jgi:hypothetical protein
MCELDFRKPAAAAAAPPGLSPIVARRSADICGSSQAQCDYQRQQMRLRLLWRLRYAHLLLSGGQSPELPAGGGDDYAALALLAAAPSLAAFCAGLSRCARRRAGVSCRSPKSAQRVPTSIVVEGKSNFESDLVMRHPAIFDMAARLNHLEPADLPQRARGATDGVVDRIFDAFLRRTGDLDDPVNVIGHRHPSLKFGA